MEGEGGGGNKVLIFHVGFGLEDKQKFWRRE